MPDQLVCKVVNYDAETRTVFYEVWNGGSVVAEGGTSPGWLRHDAGSYHTKEDFEAFFPEGCIITYDESCTRFL